MSKYFFDDKRNFIIEDYHKAKTFSSFLPGIAGEDGVPIWAFYVNRGQGISSFGIENKNHPIMEFFPANGAYQTVSTNGFRTFIKDVDQDQVVEPFGTDDSQCFRCMGIEKDQFFVEETNKTMGLTTNVRYTILANKPFGGLVRQVTITNVSGLRKAIEVVDGMPALLPYGVENGAYKEMSNLLQSWMEVSERDSKVPFYKLRSSTSDESVVSEVSDGYFYLSDKVDRDDVINIYDPNAVFAYQTDLREPIGFKETDIKAMASKEQVFANKVPCAFQMQSVTLEDQASIIINSVIGYSRDYDMIASYVEKLNFSDFVSNAFIETKAEIDHVCSEIETKTGLPLFDEYIKQSYLDNVLRGGKPLIFEAEEGNHVYHIYSRKHGDPERDYNFFSLEPSKYSQGNGNYRDVNQNRRNDVIINPKVGDFNVWMFYNLVQADGYNPLSIRGTNFNVPAGSQGKLHRALTALGLNQGHVSSIVVFAEQNFTPGTLMKKLDSLGISDKAVLEAVLKFAVQKIDVVFGEGFWSDHFTYNLDLVESFQYMYPDRMEKLLFGRKDYKFFSSPVSVLPRNEKYGINDKGQVRQYESIKHKENHEGIWHKDTEGNELTTDLFNKMMVLVLTKALSLDPFGIGLEMDGDKPGWNDALNGLPGLLGSGVSETIELKRHIDWLIATLNGLDRDRVKLLASTNDLLAASYKIFKQDMDSQERWKQLNELKEGYRTYVNGRINNVSYEVDMIHIIEALEAISKVLEVGLNKGLKENDGMMPSYYINEVKEYKALNARTHFGLPAVEAVAFDHRPLPYFLEGPARYLKTISGEAAMMLHEKVKSSGIFDKQLKMFKTSESLDEETLEIGRIRAFTPGWLERESVFLHMTYKYLLSLLQSGSYEAFFEAIDTNMIPFLDPAVYGRPTTENSSFLASDVNPNPAVIGQGFVARLSGSTAEAISMWVKMFIGSEGFKMVNGSLTFRFAPVLQSRFFDEDGKVSFTLFGKTKVTYINPQKKDTYGENSAEVVKVIVDGETMPDGFLSGTLAQKLRNGEVTEISVELS